MSKTKDEYTITFRGGPFDGRVEKREILGIAIEVWKEYSRGPRLRKLRYEWTFIDNVKNTAIVEHVPIPRKNKKK